MRVSPGGDKISTGVPPPPTHTPWIFVFVTMGTQTSKGLLVPISPGLAGGKVCKQERRAG